MRLSLPNPCIIYRGYYLYLCLNYLPSLPVNGASFYRRWQLSLRIQVY
jgi:hypothetical protein